MRTAAILPVKRFAQAKHRLGASVADQLRLELARAMVADVLLALSRTPSIELTIVVTCEDSLAKSAPEQGVLVIPDDENGQSAAVTLGVRRALTDGFERVLCIPGDCPALDPQELEPLVNSSASDTSEVVIVPDRHGTGTNGLLLSPPDAISPSFGPDSCERHRELALTAGATWRLEHPSSLLLDIDTGADLAALRERLAGTDTRASRTRAVLGQPERQDVLSISNSG
jgi:2-phospho-L-lactate/phosphoenolpyruvate guanylyltransferase